ncbi:MAG: peptidase MA family metallohydrolase [Gemmatimonadota bacterium]
MGPRDVGGLKPARGLLLARAMLSARAAAAALVAACAIGVSACAPDDDRPPADGAAPATSPPLDLRSDPGLARLAESIGRRQGVWGGMPGIDDSLVNREPVTVWFVRDLTSLDSLGLGRSEPWVAGVAEPARRLIALRVDGPQRDAANLLSVYRHEAAHVALHTATGGNVPRWLHEGYAQAASGTWDWDEAWRLQFVLLRGGQGLLADLDRGFRSDFEPRTAYLLSYTAVQTLQDLGGDAGLRALFARLRGGDTIDGALRAVYGLTYDRFEERWRKGVLDRYGWLYLLSRTAFLWFGVTVLVIGLGVARVRRDRRRLREMKESERREDLAALADEAELALGSDQPTDDLAPPRAASRD